MKVSTSPKLDRIHYIRLTVARNLLYHTPIPLINHSLLIPNANVLTILHVGKLRHENAKPHTPERSGKTEF